MPSSDSNTAEGRYWNPKNSLAAISICTLIGLIVVVIQSMQIGTWSGVVSQGTIMLAVSGAATMIGGLVGFLFGIPRRLQKEQEPSQPISNKSEDNDPLLYEGNTNLEQISDWLTKIIVGVTLVKLADIVLELEKYSSRIAMATGRPSDAAFSAGIMIFFFVCGFLTGYLWSRLYLGRALSEAESRIRLQKKLDKLQQQAQDDAESIAAAKRQFSSDESQKYNTDELFNLLSKASAETNAYIFSLAENNRWRNWKTDKQAMEYSIPVFEALIKIDGQDFYHRNIGQLAYCLKDKRSPDIESAEKLFTRAIKSRGRASEQGWGAYEANRAVSRIGLQDKFFRGFGSKDEANKAIQQDIEVALKDYWVAEWLRKDPMIKKWAKEVGYNLPPE